MTALSDAVRLPKLIELVSDQSHSLRKQVSNLLTACTDDEVVQRSTGRGPGLLHFQVPQALLGMDGQMLDEPVDGVVLAAQDFLARSAFRLVSVELFEESQLPNRMV